MKLIYTCFGGAHSSPVAASIHLGLLPRSRTPSRRELLAVHGFDRTQADDHGRLRFVGQDDVGREVYVLGRGIGDAATLRALVSGYELAAGSRSDLQFIDTLPCVNWAMRIGGLLSRVLRWEAVGRPIVVAGTRRAYPCLVRLVDSVRAGTPAATGK